MCNNNIKQNGEIQNLLNNETKLSADYLNGSDIDDELNETQSDMNQTFTNRQGLNQA